MCKKVLSRVSFASLICNNSFINKLGIKQFPIHLINWDHLQYFLAFANDSRLVVAARTLRVNHATISRRVKAEQKKGGVHFLI
jgi:hypothetical protein